MAEWMFSGGNSMTWLVGHKLVTITTAGCAVNSLKQGMCDRYGAPRRQPCRPLSLVPGKSTRTADPHRIPVVVCMCRLVFIQVHTR